MPQFPVITAYDDDGEEEVDVFIGDEILLNNTYDTFLPPLAQIKHFDCGIMMVSFTLGTMKQK